jgi:hypothetical protein
MLLVDARLATAESRLRSQLCESLDLRLIVGHALLTPPVLLMSPRAVSTLHRTAHRPVFGGHDISTPSTDGVGRRDVECG